MVFFGLRRAASTLWLYLGGGAVPKYGAIGHLRVVRVSRVKKHVSVGGATPLTSNNQLNRVGLQFDQNSERKNMGAWVDGI
ncbi:hypothetical protein AVO44_06095 [Ruegeria profundi]|uniref:Uncharacterized protein n=1 Tax=Ruegeria profundi TaxID=1685378 RepID=A0A0X3TVN4_9RHOB|nr:hypothetical protein AVO44_06095 [Ruegeria profundi]